jgi:hypothetical protein
MVCVSNAVMIMVLHRLAIPKISRSYAECQQATGRHPNCVCPLTLTWAADSRFWHPFSMRRTLLRLLEVRLLAMVG